MRASLIEYAQNYLMAETDIIQDLPSSAIKRGAGRNSVIQKEVVVTFKSYQDRDYYKSMAYRLAGKKNFSIRLEIPLHLLGQHRVLGTAAQSLRAANKGCRTNIRFDDDQRRMVLDYKLDGEPWGRLAPDQAAQVVSQRRGGAPSMAETSAEAFGALLGPTTGSNSTPLGGV